MFRPGKPAWNPRARNPLAQATRSWTGYLEGHWLGEFDFVFEITLDVHGDIIYVGKRLRGGQHD